MSKKLDRVIGLKNQTTFLINNNNYNAVGDDSNPVNFDVQESAEKGFSNNINNNDDDDDDDNDDEVLEIPKINGAEENVADKSSEKIKSYQSVKEEVKQIVEIVNERRNNVDLMTEKNNFNSQVPEKLIVEDNIINDDDDNNNSDGNEDVYGGPDREEKKPIVISKKMPKKNVIKDNDMETDVIKNDKKIVFKNKSNGIITPKKQISAIKAEMSEQERQKKILEPKVANVKESIRNIIQQFKEFEKDLSASAAGSLNNKINNWSRKKKMGRINEEKVVNTQSSSSPGLPDDKPDEFEENDDEAAVLDNAKGYLRDVIDQFYELKDELSFKENYQFQDIADKFDERPITDTLILFSEALKDLVQERKGNKQKEITLEDNDVINQIDDLPKINVPTVTEADNNLNEKKKSKKSDRQSREKKIIKNLS